MKFLANENFMASGVRVLRTAGLDVTFIGEDAPSIKRLGPEMKSTGEAIYFIKDLKDPYFRELERNRSMYLYN